MNSAPNWNPLSITGNNSCWFNTPLEAEESAAKHAMHHCCSQFSDERHATSHDSSAHHNVISLTGDSYDSSSFLQINYPTYSDKKKPVLSSKCEELLRLAGLPPCCSNTTFPATGGSSGSNGLSRGAQVSDIIAYLYGKSSTRDNVKINGNNITMSFFNTTKSKADATFSDDDIIDDDSELLLRAALSNDDASTNGSMLLPSAPISIDDRRRLRVQMGNKIFLLRTTSENDFILHRTSVVYDK